MRRVDIAAWTDLLGVGDKELAWALKARIRVVEETHADVNRLRLGLRGAPDEELVLLLEAACRSLGMAGERLEEHVSDLARAS
ncbi:hypothetical protein GCM10022415_16040 [Knoellia locipacati]|uniref:ANTAR domain-containing protein n=1 Tax=Knoellia locipacati TaxID=882824 RepID=A0A512T058_9MICO|nr:hypothetical protein [Knoellia locipacati]GEQ13554.1 hypothetical protein KLO01_16010 [Knoellia locipacati]